MNTPTQNTEHTPGPWLHQGQGMLLHPASHAAITTERIETSLGFIEILDMTNEPEANLAIIIRAPALLAENARLREQVAQLTEALQDVMRVFVGGRSVANCQGGEIADKARSALSAVERGTK